MYQPLLNGITHLLSGLKERDEDGEYTGKLVRANKGVVIAPYERKKVSGDHRNSKQTNRRS